MSIRNGINLVKEKNFHNVIVEIDSLMAKNLILDQQEGHHLFKTLIEDCKFLLARCNCSFVFVYGQGNNSANCLANLGLVQEESFLFFETPPAQLLPLLEVDRVGHGYVRP